MFSRLNIIFFLALSFASFSQEKTQSIEEVRIIFSKLNKHRLDSTHLYLTKNEIDLLQADDLGELMHKIPGANIKSYGGLGGLKTVSIRGLGSQHTRFVIDGFTQLNAQTGQVNLGQIQLDNIETILIQRGGSSETFIPVSAQLSGNAVLLNSLQSAEMFKKFQIRVATRFGSFGQFETYLLAKVKANKWHFSTTLKHRQANGNYQYSFQNYETTIRGTRKNNDYEDVNLGLSTHFIGQKGLKFNLYFHFLEAKQGLPGAVILYNDFSNQRLSNQQLVLRSDIQGTIKKLNYRFYADYSKDSLRYTDPSYMNAHGTYQSSFVTNSITPGLVFARNIGKIILINLGTEARISELHSHESFTAKPFRLHQSSFLKSSFSFRNTRLIAQLGMNYVAEKNQNGMASENVTRFNPFLEWQQKIGKKYTLNLYYRNAFRMPNFNELYYNNIGNTALKPEDAHQLSLGNNITLIDSKSFYLGTQINGFYHLVDNMILAIPTKNLFIWSFQNIGKNEIFGAEAMISLAYKWNEKWNTNLTTNYTFQHSVDVTNRENPTFGHQIAYVPKHVVNGDLTLNYKKFGVRFSSFYNSKRYSLNENIPSNEIASFVTFDVALFGTIKLTQQQHLRIQCTVKNITNQSYAFVKSFVMPGTHFLFSINYAFN